MADHSLGAALYAGRAVEVTGAAVDMERAWQVERLPDELRDMIVSALGRRFGKRWTCPAGDIVFPDHDLPARATGR
jgi:hypothetical protein